MLPGGRRPFGRNAFESIGVHFYNSLAVHEKPFFITGLALTTFQSREASVGEIGVVLPPLQ